MSEKVEKLSIEEFVELDDLLASIPEEFYPMDASEADGYLTGLALLPEKPGVRDWLPLILSGEGRSDAGTGSPDSDTRLRRLLMRRLSEIEATLAASEPLDPLYFEGDDEDGKAPESADAAAALEPFALGFLEAIQSWPGILDADCPQIAQALPGILRHLPEESLGDFKEAKEALDRDAPLEDLPAALSDLVSCIAEIANATKGYDIPELCETSESD